MEFRCEDLREAGIVLLPSTSPDYDPLLADIQRRIDHPPPEAAGMTDVLRRSWVGTIDSEKRYTSAVLLNQSGKTIAAIDAFWRCEDIRGSVYNGAIVRTGSIFGVQPPLRKIMEYWTTILPGSTRYLGENGLAGDNTDVRPPAPDEIWKRGGFGSGGGEGRAMPRFPARSVTLILDGVFFTDGEFVGPNENKLWEEVTSTAKSRLAVVKAVRTARDRGVPAADILDHLREDGASQPLGMRQLVGDVFKVNHLAAQANTQLPNFRKRLL